VLPPSIISSPDIFQPTMKSSPTCARTSSSTSRQKRVRFSTDPPYLSTRSLADGLRNWSSRCWPAAISSTPSSPPSLVRLAAAPKARTTRRMSKSSITLGAVRCWGSWVVPGEIGHSQSPVSQPTLRPIWVIWHMIAPPWPWTRAAKRSKWGRIESSPR
jgi:hypothetical protein